MQTPLILFASLLSLSSLATGGVFQETTQEQNKKEEEPTLLDRLDEEVFGGGEDLKAEMARLFQEVERNLIAIDDQLAAAGAGEIELSEVEESGLEKLLRSQKNKSNQVLSDIDRILEITEQLGGT